MLLPDIDTSAPAQDCKPSLPPMFSFQHKPFPPPSLAGVPVEYIFDQLRNLAPHYWDKPETADCTIIVPVPHAEGRPMHPSIAALFPPDAIHTVSSMYGFSGAGRRATQPALNAVPRISLQLHVDYLAAHSSFLRGLFSGACPMDLMYSLTPPVTTSSSHPVFGNSIPPNRLPRLMPCSPDHPIIYLPIPDPTSFHLLIHWMYFGDISYIEDCLHQGIIQWEGIARNVEYLGLSTELKVFLQRWYQDWLHPDRTTCTYDSDDDSDTVFSDYDGEDSDSTASDSEEIDTDDEKEQIRGRTRTTRPLSMQSQRPHSA
ncbi:hypothetical protein BDQ12DRAFT_662716 [Crucibulum laeve]|uniref:BTB domain-containing protein n=1 Tax=Crucibulum laeve TaxID=68775 RepID=A0A5C3MCJ7_9AGAR|nr:hypothetical protein BDQ12DRAFT_662716 [Crucibulum laeve]